MFGNNRLTLDDIIVVQDSTNLFNPETQSFDDKRLFKNSNLFGVAQLFPSRFWAKHRRDSESFPVASWLSLPLTQRLDSPVAVSPRSRVLSPSPRVHSRLLRGGCLSRQIPEPLSSTMWNVGRKHSALTRYVLIGHVGFIDRSSLTFAQQLRPYLTAESAFRISSHWRDWCRPLEELSRSRNSQISHII